jgi:hypothetical protein
MPRERIQGAEPTNQFDVIVGWSKELNDYVEIATITEDAHDRLTAWTEAPQLPDGTTYNSSIKPTEPGTSFRFFDGWHVFLNRQQINELIRVLRRARNAAFGADE